MPRHGSGAGWGLPDIFWASDWQTSQAYTLRAHRPSQLEDAVSEVGVDDVMASDGPPLDDEAADGDGVAAAAASDSPPLDD